MSRQVACQAPGPKDTDAGSVGHRCFRLVLLPFLAPEPWPCCRPQPPASGSQVRLAPGAVRRAGSGSLTPSSQRSS